MLMDVEIDKTFIIGRTKLLFYFVLEDVKQGFEFWISFAFVC